MSKKNQDYDEFIEKFKPKKTTDDCYTPRLCMRRYWAGHARTSTLPTALWYARSIREEISSTSTTPTRAKR